MEKELKQIEEKIASIYGKLAEIEAMVSDAADRCNNVHDLVRNLQGQTPKVLDPLAEQKELIGKVSKLVWRKRAEFPDKQFQGMIDWAEKHLPANSDYPKDAYHIRGTVGHNLDAVAPDDVKDLLSILEAE